MDYKINLSSIVQPVIDKIPKNGVLVLGCSTSEVAGGDIGKSSVPEIGLNIVKNLIEILTPKNIFLAVQCCEHLNRALVIEEKAALLYGFEKVLAIPTSSAGGSCGAAALQLMEQPILVESVSAHGGIDIGGTLIGMHIKHVAVPIKLEINTFGAANVTVAYSRPKLIGGKRTKYSLEDE